MQTIHSVVFGLLIMGKNLKIRKPQAGDKSLIGRSGLTGFFRLSVNNFCHVHRTGTDTQHHTLVVFQDFR